LVRSEVAQALLEPAQRLLSSLVRRLKISNRARQGDGFEGVQTVTDLRNGLFGTLQPHLSLAQRHLGILDPLPSLHEELVRGRTYFHTEGRGSGGVRSEEHTS